jgi:hypothetical protein
MDLSGDGSMLWGMLFGAVGVGYVMHGRKLQRMLPLACGLGLMVVPYFITGTVALLLTCGVLCAAPFLITR